MDVFEPLLEHRQLLARAVRPPPDRRQGSRRSSSDLSLWDKRKTILKDLSGGMKRRVMIAKALSHEPDILFLDEPTAGVDVELRRDMWNLVRRLRETERPSSSPPTISRKPRRWPTASASSARAS